MNIQKAGDLTSHSEFQAVIFDCDGTLVDSEPLAIQALLAEAALLGHHMDFEEGFACFKGVKMVTCVEMIEAKFHCALPEHFVDKVRQRVAVSFAENLQAISGARELLSELKVPYCIASNGPQEKIQQSLSASGLVNVMKGPIFSAYDVGHWKPSPGLFLHAARAMGVEPGRCAVVEDSEPGIEAGLAAGMTVFALQLSPADPPTNPRHGVIYLKSLAALLEHL